MKTVLTIAGSDSSGGAGIQADIKTIAAHGLYATSAITALTAQNTMGVTAIQETTPDFLAAQLDAVFTDIPPDAVKIGMVANAALIAVIAAKLAQYKPAAIVADPVMVSTSGSALLAQDALETLIHTLLPSATLITPNIH
ncbi:MAG: bifunctional hydroxymethylpyrimidine kinase/phosphomethylpyrimidine kinase, partial [Eubacterium aggregans]